LKLKIAFKAAVAKAELKCKGILEIVNQKQCQLGVNLKYFRMNSSVLYSIFKCRFIPNTGEYLPVLRADSNKI
jgi:hypothetical protein